MSAWLDKFFPDPEMPPHDVPAALRNCEKCPHKHHTGVCGLPVERHGIEDQCLCTVTTPSSLNSHELRTRDVIQMADLRHLDWSQRAEMTGEERKKARRERKKWVRM